MGGSTETWQVVAAAAAVVGLLALLGVAVLALQLRRVRGAQRAVLGDLGTADLVAHAAQLTARVDAATGEWRTLADGLSARMGGIEGALLRVFSRHGMVRYDAYGELSGQQSCSLALLDVRGDGVVITSIHHRDQARLYVRRILGGRPEHRLAPEEDEALALALGHGAIRRDGTIEGTPPAPRPDGAD
ncbi:DUF4446 family protein [Patulibacter brassicae]|jgi:hypothetical protein|uniref:DUF4446 family protein n=1 Tax=Patulibacter brassicae TaxID=1705717 RepID=A0ABU4VKS8_9ACTN|nr:DUF4446 family protein [Patulibacter brassicae]MDX8152456.1 DUF4446 family protein [Patulibacter brassicae]